MQPDPTQPLQPTTLRLRGRLDSAWIEEGWISLRVINSKGSAEEVSFRSHNPRSAPAEVIVAQLEQLIGYQLEAIVLQPDGQIEITGYQI